MQVERVVFLNARGLRLVGNLYPAHSKQIVILSHGYTSDKASRGRFPRLAAALNESGYNALAFDYAGCGESHHDTLHPEKLVEDLQAAIQFVQSRGFEHIALYGHSLGATLALRAYSDAIETMILSGAGTGPIRYDWSQYYSREQLQELAMTGLLTTHAGGDIKRTVVVEQAMLDFFARIDPRDLLGRVRCDVLLIHGDSEKDQEERLLLERSRDAMRYLSEGSSLVVIHGAGHSFEGYYDEVIRLTTGWLDLYMKWK
jgi:pimeloyl-ACP methyl ester carboxylesterase